MFRLAAVVTTACLAATSCASPAGPAPIADAAPVTEPAPSATVILVDPIPPEVIPNRANFGARLVEYPPVSLAEREGHYIELVEDLVIEERDNDRQYSFDNAVDVVVDVRGNMYVHDSERYRIIVYAPDGSFSRVYGGAGAMAPFRLGWISLAGERLAISTGNKITVWTLDGEHLYDRSLLRRAFDRGVQGTLDGSLVGFFEMLDRQREWWYRVERISLDEDESLAYSAVPTRRRGMASPPARAGFAATRDGAVYLTRGDEYRVQAFDSHGYPAWLLKVDWPRPASAEQESLRAPALANGACSRCPVARIGRRHALRTDGSGNLYVFPYVDDSWDRDEIPVDVYSAAGERLFAGFISDVSWLRSLGDSIYGIEYDEAADRQRVVRYRIAGPPAVVESAAPRRTNSQ